MGWKKLVLTKRRRTRHLRFSAALAIAVCAMTCPQQPVYAQAKPPLAKDARIGGDAMRTRFVADLSKEVEFKVRTLPDPYRVIVDLGDVNFQMPAGLGTQGRGLVTGFRFGNFAKGKSRIVIDTAQPIIVENAFVRPAEAGQPARLVIDIMRTTRADFMQKQAELSKQQPQKSEVATGWDSATRQEPSASASRGGRVARPVIVIDPGHGGIDPGASSNQGIYEKAVVFAFCLELKKKLEETKKFDVFLTRESDVFVPLADRMAFAQKKGAALLISLHADAIDAKHPLLGAKGPQVAQEVRGASIYTLNQQASDAEAQASAARENLSDVLAGVDEQKGARDEVSNILVDLVQRATKNEAREFSNMLVSQLKGKTSLNPKPQRFANFTVLRAPDVPSVLIELGYMSNTEDEKQLISPVWRASVAEAMSIAILKFLGRAQSRLPF
ncbi:MAG: N-acetylmuramoyl-L-alanine amidase [Hyphomicrobiales bacterium]|nr:N-acetylmuramoyl-L-alanine amidase [Hyphomicrobiales bacterium]